MPRLFELWADHSLSRAQVAGRLGISVAMLYRLMRRHKLPPRPKELKAPVPDPTPEEIAERARECRERHYAQRRAEPDQLTSSKVSQWRRGICQPGGARHA
ncbi:MAG: hypothetical protein EBS54_02085 [Betaproteobacteria bacterium]|nr:hypothetical protein [Betaproteobacteria bacterium]